MRVFALWQRTLANCAFAVLFSVHTGDGLTRGEHHSVIYFPESFGLFLISFPIVFSNLFFVLLFVFVITRAFGLHHSRTFAIFVHIRSARFFFFGSHLCVRSTSSNSILFANFFSVLRTPGSLAPELFFGIGVVTNFC